MTRGYVLVYDERKDIVGGNALLQKKAYFQNFSIGRNVFVREPICGNPGQYTLPGGKMDADLVAESGTLAATLKQFYEESGVTAERMRQLNCTDQGYYAPKNRRGRGAEFFVHYVQVDDVSALAEEANHTLSMARSVVNMDMNKDIVSNLGHHCSLSEREGSLRELCVTTGLNDDAAASYEVVPWEALLDKLLTSLEFDEACREEWSRLVREQGLGLFFSTISDPGTSTSASSSSSNGMGRGGQEAMIHCTLQDPGSNRDWLVAGVQAFLT